MSEPASKPRVRRRTGPAASFVPGTQRTVRPVNDGDAERARVVLAELAEGDAETLTMALEALGLSIRRGRVFVRFGEDGSQIRLYLDADGEFRCQWCRLSTSDFHTAERARVVAHLEQHRRSGHVVPSWVDDAVGGEGP